MHVLSIDANTHVVAYTMKRHIPFTGTPNFRDLGGYRARNGKQVRWNCFYRSGQLSNLTAGDVDQFVALGVRVICDFRRAEEAKRDPSLLPQGAPLELLQLSIDPGSAASVFQAYDANHPRDIDMARRMCAINRTFALEHHGPYSRMLEAILQLHDGALLFHCAAGKDRTGFAAALILMILDVPREVIMRDYMLTRDYFLPDRELQRLTKKYAGSTFAKLDPARIRPMLEVRPEYLQAAFDAIDERYATSEDYLEDVFALTPTKRQALQRRFLE